jgi:anaphase-promoting complex subunit 10
MITPVNPAIIDVAQFVCAQQNPLRTFFLQIAIVAMHQNGRDTHIRQVKIYSPREPNALDRSMPEASTEQFWAFSCIR